VVEKTKFFYFESLENSTKNALGGVKVDYRKLRGKIKEVYDTHTAFAKALGLDPATLSYKLNNKSEWTSGEIAKACDLLNIPLVDAHIYFFTLKV
jgi:hypothetical protein